MSIFGILNITEDSFSDGGKYLDPASARAHARALVSGGADVLDIGAASSNPQSRGVPADIEIKRLETILPDLRQANIPLSIDTFSPEVQRWALSQNVDFINDIQGFPDASIYDALASSRATLILMHSVQERGPATRIEMAPDVVFDHCLSFFETRIRALTDAGIALDRLILDPGMGFFLGTDPEASFVMLRKLAVLKARFGLPLLVSVSRKSFLRKLTGRGPLETGSASLAAELFAAAQGADHLRTHDPAALKDALAVWRMLVADGDSRRNIG